MAMRMAAASLRSLAWPLFTSQSIALPFGWHEEQCQVLVAGQRVRQVPDRLPCLLLCRLR